MIKSIILPSFFASVFSTYNNVKHVGILWPIYRLKYFFFLHALYTALYFDVGILTLVKN